MGKVTNLKKTEMAILKAQSIKLSDDVVFILTFQYHTEKNDEGKTDRSKSTYRWLGRISRISDIRNGIREMMADVNRLHDFKWPNDPSWQGAIFPGEESTNYRGARWLDTKLKKMVPWEKGLMLLGGYKNKQQEYNLNAIYPTQGYTTTNGDTIDITDKEALLAHVGQNVYRPHIQKSKLPKPC